MCSRSVYYVTSQPFSAPPWRRAIKPIWLHPEESKTEATEYFFWVNVGRKTTQSLQMETFEHFQADLCLGLGVPVSVQRPS